MTETLHGIQVTNRCTWYDGQRLCSDPAPYLIHGSSYCTDHTLIIQQESGIERAKPFTSILPC